MITRRMTNTADDPYKDGKARYEARVRGPGGKVITRTFRTAKAAQQWEREKLNEKDAGTWVAQTGGRVRLRDFATEWLEGADGLSPATRRIYGDNLRLHVYPVLGDHPIGGITTEVCDRWLGELRKKDSRQGGRLSPASVHQTYRTLHRVLEVATRTRRIGRNPLDGVEAPKLSSIEMRFLNHTELASLADAIAPRYQAFVLIAGYCGLRMGELRGLRRRDVDLLHRTIMVTQQLVDVQGGGFEVTKLKTRKARRSVPVPPHVLGVLEDHLASDGYGQPGSDGLVFTSPDGEPLRPENFRRREWRPACERASIPPLRIHDLRHTCASLAIAAGADVLVLQRMLGHASAAMTLDRYGHLMPGQADEIARRLSEAACAAPAMLRAVK
jgi:integrase